MRLSSASRPLPSSSPAPSPRIPSELGTTEASHGALLTTSELLATSFELKDDDLVELFEHAWALRDHRERFMRRAVLALLPRFAQHCAQVCRQT